MQVAVRMFKFKEFFIHHKDSRATLSSVRILARRILSLMYRIFATSTLDEVGPITIKRSRFFSANLLWPDENMVKIGIRVGLSLDTEAFIDFSPSFGHFAAVVWNRIPTHYPIILIAERLRSTNSLKQNFKTHSNIYYSSNLNLDPSSNSNLPRPWNLFHNQTESPKFIVHSKYNQEKIEDILTNWSKQISVFFITYRYHSSVENNTYHELKKVLSSHNFQIQESSIARQVIKLSFIRSSTPQNSLNIEKAESKYFFSRSSRIVTVVAFKELDERNEYLVKLKSKPRGTVNK